MKEITTYLDCRNKPTRLTEEELNWFHQIVEKCKAATGCNVEIIAYNHDLYRGKSVNALGCCLTNNDKNPLADDADSLITIDCYFIAEQYGVVFRNDFNISMDTLEHVIAHEIAHLHVWRHGKKHTALTEELYQKIQAA